MPRQARDLGVRRACLCAVWIIYIDLVPLATLLLDHGSASIAQGKQLVAGNKGFLMMPPVGMYAPSYRVWCIHGMAHAESLWMPEQASDAYLDLIRAPHVLYGVKYIDLVSLWMPEQARQSHTLTSRPFFSKWRKIWI